MNEKQIVILSILFAVFLIFVVAAGLLDNKNINGIKAKTVGDGQHGTARWATKAEIQRTFSSLPFEPQKWRRGKECPKIQGTVIGCRGMKNTTALVDTGDVHTLMIRNGMKRVRKKESSFILASQNIEDFLVPEVREFTKPLMSIPNYNFIFNVGNASPDEFMDMTQLIRSEYNLIDHPEKGTCLFRCGNERYLLQVHAPEYKEKLFGKAGGR